MGGVRTSPGRCVARLTNVPLANSDQTATLAVDSTGEMWIASDTCQSTTIEVRYSVYPYVSFSAPLQLAAGIATDDDLGDHRNAQW